MFHKLGSFTVTKASASSTHFTMGLVVRKASLTKGKAALTALASNDVKKDPKATVSAR